MSNFGAALVRTPPSTRHGQRLKEQAGARNQGCAGPQCVRSWRRCQEPRAAPEAPGALRCCASSAGETLALWSFRVQAKSCPGVQVLPGVRAAALGGRRRALAQQRALQVRRLLRRAGCGGAGAAGLRLGACIACCCCFATFLARGSTQLACQAMVIAPIQDLLPVVWSLCGRIRARCDNLWQPQEWCIAARCLVM